MPIIAHCELPAFARLKDEGEIVLSKNRATKQSIRELHIGLLNIMPDAAIEATERQFFRLIGHSNQIVQFYLHPFTLPTIKRGEKTQLHIDKYYKSFTEIKNQGLDALIITGANVENPDLQKAPFYLELQQVVNWAYENVTSTLCSCLATHAVMDFFYQQKRNNIGAKCWGVFPHKVVQRNHPLINGVNTCFDVPHSRYNEINTQQFQNANVEVLVDSAIGAHLCVSEDLFRLVFFQGHPEYDTISILKEYKREIIKSISNNSKYPPFPQNYLNAQSKAILNEFKTKLLAKELTMSDFPEKIIAQTLDNTWHDSTRAIINNWIGCVYQVTHKNIKLPFMDNIDPNNPLGIK